MSTRQSWWDRSERRPVTTAIEVPVERMHVSLVIHHNPATGGQVVECEPDQDTLSQVEDALREHLPYGMEGAAHAQALAVFPVIIGQEIELRRDASPAERALALLAGEHARSRTVH